MKLTALPGLCAEGLARCGRALLFDNPLTQNLRRYRSYKGFSGPWAGTFWGIYNSIPEAASQAPRTKPVGYDSPEPAAMYRERHTRVYPSDYPVIFWLSQILAETKTLVDIGGHVGLTYYAYRKYIAYPDSFQWIVWDVPNVVGTGRELAKERGESKIEFVDSLSDPSIEADVVLASGSLQYIEGPTVRNFIRSRQNRPKHIIINRTPLYSGAPFVTVQNIGPAFCPYQIFNRDAFVREIEECGYTLVDEWQNLEHRCLLPFEKGRSVEAFTGLYFRLTA